jgi:cob(I)alamin adenosyltransferase
VKSQVTTKRGDTGSTVTIAGETLSKSHAIFECCGRIDTLRAQTALCRLLLIESGHPQAARLGEFLYWLLHVYFVIGSQCNDPGNRRPDLRRRDVGPGDVASLENWQQEFEGAAKLPKQFILSAANVSAAQVDLACTLARDAERSVVRLRETSPGFAAEHILVFLNRLSDTLFMLARYLDGGSFTTVDYSVFEEPKGTTQAGGGGPSGGH